jgi:tetratricopeptide (TPR) repeat protein
VTAADLMEQGLRAYTHGQSAEAERCWRELLRREPGHERARSYLALLEGRRTTPVPLPAPGPGAERPRPSPPRLPEPPVPLPAPARKSSPSWMRPPITMSPTASAVAPPDRAARGAPAEPRRQIAAPGRPDRVTVMDYAPSPWDQGPAFGPAVVLTDGDDGLDLASVEEQSGMRSLVPEVASPAPAPKRRRSDVEVWMEGARELFALGDFSGSLEMIEKILKVDPSHAEARRYLEQNEATLIAMYESKLGPAASIPRLATQPEEVMWLNLDHRAGFLLAQIDGMSSYEDLFALSGLPRLDTARILATLMQEGVITS